MLEQVLTICFGIWLYFVVGLIVTRVVVQEEDIYESYITRIVAWMLWPLTM